MEEEILWLDASQKATVNETARFRRCFEYWKTWQCSSRYHQRWALTLQFNLPKQTRNLHCVNRRSLSPRAHHQLKIVVRKFAYEPSRKTNSKRIKKNKLISEPAHCPNDSSRYFAYLLILFVYESSADLYCRSSNARNFGSLLFDSSICWARTSNGVSDGRSSTAATA